MADQTVELVKLRESLRLCQAELASLRSAEESWAERLAPLEHERSQFIALSEGLAERLAEDDVAPTGLRSRLRNALARTLPSEHEAEQVAQLHATPLFDAAWYLRQYPTVVTSGMSPTLHYLRRGAKNGRNPGPNFDTAAYRAAHPDLPRRANPLLHFVATLGYDNNRTSSRS
ncbi:hypothetical protein [Nocardioides sp. Iso805N]|uniref:hypothetical protein n=1 Tax=Nocardioides sp. Iso805N TaxID=1283287 RepID=UPI0012FC22EE|nr:hypothetical protein [Nocardioides sp. Iso805N]